MPAIDAAINGDRDHPAAPRTPAELAADARAVVAEGARVVHLHPYDSDGRQTLAAEPCAQALRAVRAACPGIAISLSTSAAIEPDPERRRALIAGWTVLPDLAGEPGRGGDRRALRGPGRARGGHRGGAARARRRAPFVASGLAPRCTRVLFEPLDADPAAAVAHAAAMGEALAVAGIGLEQVHHGDGIASWAVNRRALELGHGIRTGLEDTPVLPDGRVARDNSELVRAAAALLAGA